MSAAAHFEHALEQAVEVLGRFRKERELDQDLRRFVLSADVFDIRAIRSRALKKLKAFVLERGIELSEAP